jgi:DNA-binding response OmpR family regulator
MRILFIDDEVEGGSRLYVSGLALQGHEVTTARSAADARQCLMAAGEGLYPDLVVSDVLLPGENTGQLLADIRASIPGVQIWLLTALPQAQIEYLITGTDSRVRPDKTLQKFRTSPSALARLASEASRKEHD